MQISLRFCSNFVRSDLRKSIENRFIFDTFPKTSILRKSLFFLRKIAIFQLRTLPKSTKNASRITIAKNTTKKTPKNRFRPPESLPKRLPNPPKTVENRPETDVDFEPSKLAFGPAPRNFRSVTKTYKPSFRPSLHINRYIHTLDAQVGFRSTFRCSEVA